MVRPDSSSGCVCWFRHCRKKKRTWGAPITSQAWRAPGL